VLEVATPATIAESATATYTVVLDSEPTSDVTIRLTSSDTTAATVTPLHSMTNDNSFPNRIIVIHTSNRYHLWTAPVATGKSE
jgi:hypothetical protein